jgi:hypothetical protein
MNYLSELLIDANYDSIDSTLYEIDDLHPIDCVEFDSTEEQIRIKLHIAHYDGVLYSELTMTGILNNADTPITFFELFGFGSKYRNLFLTIEESTILSKEDISNLLRHETICHQIPDIGRCYFKLSIPKSYIKTPMK